MPENPYEPPKEVNDRNNRPYKFQWWHGVIALLVFAAILALAEAWTEGDLQKYLPWRLKLAAAKEEAWEGTITPAMGKRSQ